MSCTSAMLRQELPTVGSWQGWYRQDLNMGWRDGT
jgi:hypothetical protein